MERDQVRIKSAVFTKYCFAKNILFKKYRDWFHFFFFPPVTRIEALILYNRRYKLRDVAMKVPEIVHEVGILESILVSRKATD